MSNQNRALTIITDPRVTWSLSHRLMHLAVPLRESVSVPDIHSSLVTRGAFQVTGVQPLHLTTPPSRLELPIERHISAQDTTGVSEPLKYGT